MKTQTTNKHTQTNFSSNDANIVLENMHPKTVQSQKLHTTIYTGHSGNHRQRLLYCIRLARHCQH